MTKEQIQILEDALELLEEYPNELQSSFYGKNLCSVCYGVNDVKNHNCKLTSTRTKLNQLIWEFKND